MTSYRRRGHWRTSKNGNVHWVSSHYVERGSLSPEAEWALARMLQPRTMGPAVPRRVRPMYPMSARKPNAACPVCGAAVFYYQNEHGSRVFFDALGPPWPKHPCTDQALASSTAPAPLSMGQTNQLVSPRVSGRGAVPPHPSGPYGRETTPLPVKEWRVLSTTWTGAVTQFVLTRGPIGLFTRRVRVVEQCYLPVGYLVYAGIDFIEFFDFVRMSPQRLRLVG